LIIALSTLPAWAQGDETRYFEETRFNVSGKFLEFYDRNGGLAIFGYPLTRVLTENGRQVQYFQRVRMERHVDDQRRPFIQIGMLGEQLGYRQDSIPATEIPPEEHSDKRYFPETGHTISFAFLKFYRENGGMEIFGYPISEWIIEANGRIVQYFQRGKMEWYPENPPGQRVQLGMLGTIYVEQFVDPIYRQADDLDALSEATPLPTPTPVIEHKDISLEVRELVVTANPRYSIVDLNGTQTLHIYVRNQDGHGISGASVNVRVQYKGSRTDSFTLAATNTNGYTELEFPIQGAPPGYVVIVNLVARYGDVQGDTTTAFLPWW
jgi:hypothetical protein